MQYISSAHRALSDLFWKKKKRPQKKRVLLAFTDSGFSHFFVNENLPNSRLSLGPAESYTEPPF